MGRNANTKEIKCLSFCKGIAMICIFLAHAPQRILWIDDKWTAWGANGVKLLFVIAGFLTAKSYTKKNFEIKYFWKKRFWRLAPLYWCAILFWSILYAVDESKVLTFFMEDYDLVAILLNVLLLNGLFIHGNNSVVPGGWYVGAIALFYLLAPMIIKGVYWLWRRFPFLAKILPIVSFCPIYIINWSLYRIPFMTKMSTFFEIYYSMLFQLPSLLLGINLWFEVSENEMMLKYNNIKILIAMLLVGVAAWYSTYINNDFSYLVWGYMMALVFIFCYNNAHFLTKCKLINQLGDMSYEFFLVHLFFTIAILPIIAQLLSKVTNAFCGYLMSLLCTFLISYIISWTIWKGRLLIENRKRVRKK